MQVLKLDISRQVKQVNNKSFVMSAMKDIVAGECGTSNPLVHATQHVTKNQGYKQQGKSGVII